MLELSEFIREIPITPNSLFNFPCPTQHITNEGFFCGITTIPGISTVSHSYLWEEGVSELALGLPDTGVTSCLRDGMAPRPLRGGWTRSADPGS